MKIILLALIFPSILIPLAYAENIVYTNSVPSWYEYDCTDSTPSVFTQSTPDVNRNKYFSWTDGSDCHAILLTYNLIDIANISNVTSVSVLVDSKSMLIENDDLSNQYVNNCDLYIFGDPTISGGVITASPSVYNSFSCSGAGDSSIQEVTIPYTSGQYGTFETDIMGGNNTYSIMIFPNHNSTLLSNLVSNGYTYAIGKYANELDVTGDGFNCAVISASNWCNFYNAPWTSVKKALGEDYIGDWFYVLIFMPFPMSVFLLTRNGAYAGFVSLPIMLSITVIDQVVYEVALSMLLIAGGFGFYEVIRKKLME